MDIFSIFKDIIAFFQANTLFAIVAVIVLLYVMYRISRFLFTILFIALFLAGALYLILTLSSTGVSYKKEIVQEKALPSK